MSEVNIDVPCVQLPDLPEIPSVSLFGGVELSGFLDISQGMPSQCTVNASLMLQLAPLLASLTPMIKILNVLGELQAVFEGLPVPDLTGLIKALTDLSPIILSVQAPGMIITVAGILRLIVSSLNCFITQLESSISFQAKIDGIQADIDLNPALDTPVLQASLACAQMNAELSMQHTMASLGPILPLLNMVKPLGQIAGIDLDFSLDFSADAKPTETISSLKETIATMESVLQALP